MGLNHFTITDHGSVGSWIAGFQAAEELEMQFIPGIELYLENQDETNKKQHYHHITVIAKNQTGLKNLIKIYNNSYIKWSKKITPKNILLENHEGIILLSGCISGEPAYWLMKQQDDKARNMLQEYKNVFKNDFYIELQYHGLTLDSPISEKEVYFKLQQFAKELNIQCVATTDSHYLNKEDSLEHSLYKYIHYKDFTGKDYKYDYKKNTIEPAFNGSGYYMQTEQEAWDYIKNITQDYSAITNSELIVNKCEKTHFPEAKPLKDMYNELHSLLAEKWIQKRKGTKYEKESAERLQTELKVIKDMNFTEYFINMYNIVKISEDNNIQVGPGRGSGPSSEVNFLLGITQIDPLKNHLIFERFLNPHRFNYPDIDIDIASQYREKDGSLILGKDKLINDLLGAEFPFYGRILNEEAASGVTLFKQLSRIFGINYWQANIITKDNQCKELLEQSEYSGWLQPELQRLDIEYNDKWATFEKYIYFIYKYKGLPWNTSKHASGCMLYPTTDLNILPNNDGIPYKGHDLEDMGFIKYDILSLDALNVIREFMPKIIEKHPEWNGKFQWEDCNDPKVWENIRKGKSDFMFQFASPGMKALLTNSHINVNNISKLAELNALYRPGCIYSGIVDKYKDNSWDNDERVIGSYLKEKFGEWHSIAPIFQEDIMSICQDMAGFTMAESDDIRRAMGRKEGDRFQSYKEQFIKQFNTEKYGNIAQKVWDIIEKFTGYAFNRSHSVAYAIIAYWQEYIYTYWENESFEFLLNNNLDRQETINYLAHAKNKNDDKREIVYPVYNKLSPKYKVTDTYVFLENPIKEVRTLGAFLSNLTPDDKKAIIKYGVLDSVLDQSLAIDSINNKIQNVQLYTTAGRKFIRDLANTIPWKTIKKNKPDLYDKIQLIDDYSKFIQCLYDNNIIEKKGNNLIVHKARSDKELTFKNEIANNIKEDIRTFGISRYLSNYYDLELNSKFTESIKQKYIEAVNNTDGKPPWKNTFLANALKTISLPIIRMNDKDMTWREIQEYFANTKFALAIDEKKFENGGSKRAISIFANNMHSICVKDKNVLQQLYSVPKNTTIICQLTPEGFWYSTDPRIDIKINKIYSIIK